VLHKEPRSRCVVTEAGEEQPVIQDNVIGVEVPLEIPDVPRNMAMVGVAQRQLWHLQSCKCQVRTMMHDM
jgi:hypothetical protein